MEISDDMIETMIPAVLEQMESPATPYVKETYIRLTEKEGMDEKGALELIAQILAVCVNDMYVNRKPFDDEPYRQMLKALPLLPDESE